MTTNRSRPSDHEISRQTFLRGAVSVVATAAAFPTTRAAADPATGWGGLASSVGGTITTEMSIIPYSAPDIPNPGRGLYNWDGEIDFPIGSAATWPIGPTYYHRPLWSDVDVGTTGPSYNWASLDNLIATAASNGQRFGLRIMPISPWWANGIPVWLRGNASAITAYSYSGSTWYQPNYNSSAYLTAACNFIAALGARYDKDERLAFFEFSLYGDFSEGHVAVSGPAFGLPIPSAADSVAQLGYWDGYGDQIITLASMTQLVNAHVAAFPNTQLICTGTGACHPMPQLLSAAYTAGQIAKPEGYRYDGLTANPADWWGFIPRCTWSVDPNSYYVANNDPLIPVVWNRWEVAPLLSEQGDYTTYNAALANVVNFGVSLVASQNAGNTTDDLGNAIKYSGYRYALSSITGTTSVNSGDSISLTATWNNYNVCPTYDNWQIVYQLRNSAGTVVSSVNSSFDLKTLFNPAQCTTVSGQGPLSNPSMGPPLGASSTDTVSIPTTGLAPGTYTIAVVVTWNEHKAGATYTWNYPPMKLAQTPGPNADGSYPLTNVTLT
jgi:hypothetical protein